MSSLRATERELASACPRDPEVEPLVEIGLVILDDLQVDAVALDPDEPDVTGVERT